MGDVTKKTGFINDPFFNRTIYPAENVASTRALSYSNSGLGSASSGSLSSDLSQYSAFALNNEGSDTRYLYGIKPDGSETFISIYNDPTIRSGVNVISQTKLDNRSMFLLEKQDQSGNLIFSNSTISRDGVSYSFTSPQGDYVTPVCFVTGTGIRAIREGRETDIAVEDLRVGDRAVTASGVVRPIVWIGHRHLAGKNGSLPHDQQPVRVSAGAFGAGLPARDLTLSPGHPVLVGADDDAQGGHLVPIMCLINGTSIARDPRPSVTYWHVELDSHDILVAEGLPAESYLDWGDRPFFDQASDHALHNPDFVVPGLAARCRPVAVEGPIVEAERSRIALVFADVLAEQCAWDDTDHQDWLAA